MRVPTRVFEEVALDDGRSDAVVIAHAEVRAEDLILSGDLLQRGQCLMFAARGGELERIREPNLRRDRLINQGIEAGKAQGFEHFPGFLSTGADVAARE